MIFQESYTLKSMIIIWITEDSWILLFYFVSCKFVLFRFYLFRPVLFRCVSFRFYLFRPVSFRFCFVFLLQAYIGTDQLIVFTKFAWGLMTLSVTHSWLRPDYSPRMSFNQSPRLPNIRYDNVTLIPLVLQLGLRIGPIQRMGAN